MQAVSFAAKMLQTCSPISQCILDGQLSKAQQMLERANRLWHPASKSTQEINRCLHSPPFCCMSSASPLLQQTSKPYHHRLSVSPHSALSRC